MDGCIVLPAPINVDRSLRRVCCCEALGLSVQGSTKKILIMFAIPTDLKSTRCCDWCWTNLSNWLSSLFSQFWIFRKKAFRDSCNWDDLVVLYTLRSTQVGKTFRSDFSVSWMLCSTCLRISLLSFWRAVEHDSRILATSCVHSTEKWNWCCCARDQQQNETANLLNGVHNFLWCLFLQTSPCIYFLLGATAHFKARCHLLSHLLSQRGYLPINPKLICLVSGPSRWQLSCDCVHNPCGIVMNAHALHA